MNKQPTPEQQLELAKILLAHFTRNGISESAVVSRDTLDLVNAFVPIEIWESIAITEPTKDGRFEVWPMARYRESHLQRAKVRRDTSLTCVMHKAKWRLIQALIRRDGEGSKGRYQTLVEACIASEGETHKDLWEKLQKLCRQRVDEIEAEYQESLKRFGVDNH